MRGPTSQRSVRKLSIGFGSKMEFGVAGVGERIREEAADAQLVVRRPADIRDPVLQPVFIIRPLVLRRETADANRVIELLRSSR